MATFDGFTKTHHLGVAAEAGGVDEPAVDGPMVGVDLHFAEVDAHGTAGTGGGVGVGELADAEVSGEVVERSGGDEGQGKAVLGGH